jgi:hypothetical protein
MHIFRETACEPLQRPDRLSPRINLASHLPCCFAGLGISAKLIEQFRRRRAEEALDNGTKMRLLAWAL